MHANDTIVALATPPGEGAIGIIRLSGTDAIGIADKIFKGKKLASQPSHTIHFGRVVNGGEAIDEVVASIYKGPQSYTGEDVIELSCHGSHYVLSQVMNLCMANGARMAKAGEFTQRAFLNGKMDLAQAEAVADLIASQSGAAHRSAMYNLRGGFSEQLRSMREELIKFSALIELELDFSQEDVAFADRTQLYSLIEELTKVTQQLTDSFRLGNVIRNGVQVAIVGRPNAGKSTLLNALLNEERAIVSEIPGTTRDTIEETLNINGVHFRLIDTAGIREHTSGAIENIGIERSKAAMQRADIVVYLYDATTTTPEDLQTLQKEMEVNGSNYLLIGNKWDMVDKGQMGRLSSDDAGSHIFISAKNKENIHILRAALYDKVVKDALQTENAIITNERHHAALQQVLISLTDIRAGMDNDIPGDLLALDIRRCLHYIGEITGAVTTEDKLDYIFSKFCIGK